MKSKEENGLFNFGESSLFLTSLLNHVQFKSQKKMLVGLIYCLALADHEESN